jgi:hypothetical protein
MLFRNIWKEIPENRIQARCVMYFRGQEKDERTAVVF